MDLFTKEQKEQLLKNGSPEYRDQDHSPVVQLTLPGIGCVWLLSELEPEAPNIAFGLCDLGMGFPELGYVDLEEIKTVRVGLFGFTIFNNPDFKGNILCLSMLMQQEHMSVSSGMRSYWNHTERAITINLS